MQVPSKGDGSRGPESRFPAGNVVCVSKLAMNVHIFEKAEECPSGLKLHHSILQVETWIFQTFLFRKIRQLVERESPVCTLRNDGKSSHSTSALHTLRTNWF